MAKILFIEDNDQIVKLYKGMFTDAGYDVVVATTGNAGVDMANNVRPDVIILDIMLPGGMNGFDVLEKLKKDNELKNIPVLVLTNLDSEEKVAKEIGATDYIVKSHVDPKDVLEKIKKVL
jgi:DNA-binding response OmpR family regulator